MGEKTKNASLARQYVLPMTADDFFERLFAGKPKRQVRGLVFVNISDDEFWVRSTYGLRPNHIVARVQETKSGLNVQASMMSAVSGEAVFMLISIVVLHALVMFTLLGRRFSDALALAVLSIFWISACWFVFWSQYKVYRKVMDDLDAILTADFQANRFDPNETNNM